MAMVLRTILALAVVGVAIAQSTCEMDVLFVVDATGSVEGDYKNHVDYVRKVVQEMTIGEDQQRAGIVLYSSALRRHVVVELGSINDQEAMLNAIDALPYYGGTTFTGAALELAKEHLSSAKRSGADTLVVVVHDGFTYDDPTAAADALRADGVKVVAVGVAEKIWKEELERIAGSEDLVYIGMESASTLMDQLRCAPEPVQTTTTAAPSSSTDASSSGEESGESDESTTTTAATTTTTEGPSGCVLDIIFIMDASGSVQSTFDEELRIAAGVVDELTIGPNNARVSMVKFAGRNKDRIVFGYDDYPEKEALKEAIGNVRWLGGTTDLKAGLVRGQEAMGGSRDNAQTIVIIFTDGYSFSDIEPEASQLRDAGAMTYVIAIKKIAFHKPTLDALAGDEARVYTDDRLEEFKQEKDRVTADCRA